MGFRRVLLCAGAALALAIGLGTSAQATTAITEPSFSDFTNGAWTLGFEFSPNTNITVTALGSYFPAGATDDHGVTLWDASQNVLATATVTGTGVQGFDFTTITPLTLLAGQNYYIGANTLADNYTIDTGGSVAPEITFIEHDEIPCGGPTPCFPTLVTPGQLVDFGANFQFTAGVPEPATWTMLILGIGMIGFAARRRGQRAALAA